MKNVLVVGLGVSGRSAAKFLISKGARVTGIDRNAEQLKSNHEVIGLMASGLVVQSDAISPVLEHFDLIVMSPGIPPTHPVYAAALKLGKEVIGEIELGCRGLSNPIVGVTGTNGKTTVTLLITHILNACGKKAHALGNVGLPLTSEIQNISPNDTLVLELSSYQLETFHQRVLDAAVILNITPDHLDRYKSMQEYAEAKFLIQRCLKEGCSLYLEESVNEFASRKDKDARYYGYGMQSYLYTDLQSIFIKGKKIAPVPAHLQGYRSHELENFMAAFAICFDLKIAPGAILKAFSEFKKPPHRIEFVTEKAGVRFYDDSKGTNVDAVIRAVQSLNDPIILIAGGVDKGSAYTPWLEAFAKKVKCICAIGQAAGKMEAELANYIPVRIFPSLEQAVQHAAHNAAAGDIVLLSPGCSSFDMFRDYAHRGEEFQRIVHQL